MRLLVTGIGGFVGSRLALYLAARGEDLAGTYIGARPLLGAAPGVELFEADLLDRASLERAIAASRPGAIVNLAGLSHVGESWSRMGEYFRTNVLGTELLLDAARAVSGGAGLPVVIASSAEVYGPVPEREQPILEERMPDPRTPYAMTKAASERIALQRGAIVARSFNMIGPGQAPSFALPAFAAQLAAIERGEKEPVLHVGNLSARRDFFHVDDGAAAYRLLAEKGEPGAIYNVASGTAPSIGEALERLTRISGVAARVEVDPARVRPVDLPLLMGDAGKLRALGWAPRRTLDDALSDLWLAARAAPSSGAGASA
jgi:GDP-4-dehydro-6-deoxy-D-mannose reductase